MLSKYIKSQLQDISSNLHATLLSSSPLTSTFNNEENQIDFNELRKVRTYSLFGAITRRTIHYSKAVRWCLVTFLPFVFFVGHALAWTGFILFGIQIIGGAEINIIYPVNENENFQQEIKDNFTYDYLLNAVQKIISAKQDSITEWVQSIQQENDYTRSHFHRFRIFQDIANVFNFSPEISLGYFWDHGAGVVAVLTFIAMFVVPIGKSIFWIWYYFVPSDEWWRGWIITVTDLFGKWMLAYVYLIAVLSCSTTLSRNIDFPWFLFPLILPKDSKVNVHLSFGMSWNGLGGVLLIVCCLASLIIGQVMLWIHQQAVEWEEERRKMKDASIKVTPIQGNPRGISRTHVSNATPSSASLTPSLIDRSPFPNIDTPYLLPGEPERQQANIDNPVMIQAIQSFHNLEGLDAGQDYQAIQARRPMFSVIAKYGSRTVLANLGEEQQNQSAGVKLKLNHPKVEAMCDRVHQPSHGIRLRWTPAGKAVIWFFLFLLSAMFIMSQTISIFETKLTGFTMFVVKPKDVVKSYSIYNIAADIVETGWHGSPYHIRAFFVVTLTLMPLVRLLAVAYLWVLPLTINQQKLCFDFLEFSEAWSSLEVFLVTVFSITIEAAPLLGHLSDGMTPNLNEIISFLFPFLDSLVGADIKLLPGFWFVAAAVVLEKIVGRLITQQAATAIAERQAEILLAQLAKHARTHALETIQEDPTMREIIGDATEGLLETDAAFFFSPAGRYTVAPHTLYAGLPRHFWSGIMVRWGLLADADIVAEFGSPSSASLSPNYENHGENVLNDNFNLDNSGFRANGSANTRHDLEEGPLVF